MTRLVHCAKYDKELPGLATPPLPGDLGTHIFENVSQAAWDAWIEVQTMLINEKHLSMIDAAARAYLREQMQKFLANEDYDEPAGYVPPEI